MRLVLQTSCEKTQKLVTVQVEILKMMENVSFLKELAANYFRLAGRYI